MEQKNQGFQHPDRTVLGASQLTYPSIPASLAQLPQSAILPLNTIPGILPVSALNHPLLSSLQQQQQHRLPVQEPMILLPASAVPPIVTGEVPTQLFDSNKIQPHTFQYSQQLLLNNSQMPLLLKSSLPHTQMGPILQTPQMSHSVIMLPVSGSSDRTTNLDSSSTSTSGEKQQKECETSSQGDGEILCLKFSKEEATIHKSGSVGVKTGSTPKTKNSASPTLPVPGTQKHKPETDSDDSIGSGPCADLSQIISKLPAGWQVVGITDLNQPNQSSSLSVSPASSIPLLLSSETSLSMPEVTSNPSHNLLTTEIKLPHDQPRLVSVNLNSSSSPAVTDTVVSESPANGLTCSVKMDDIPNAHNLTIKTEYEDTTKNDATETHYFEKCIKVERDVLGKCSDPEFSNQLGELNKAKQTDSIQPTIHAIETSQVSNNKDMLESNWTIVGVTALPQLPTTNTATVAQSETALSTGQLSNRENDSANLSTILKIPLRPPVAPPEEAENSKINHKIASKKVAEIIQNNHQIPLNSLSSVSTEDLKWTVVGVVGSSVNSPPMDVPGLSLTAGHSLKTTLASSLMSELPLPGKVKEELKSAHISPEVPPLTCEPLTSEKGGKKKRKSEKRSKIPVSISKLSPKDEPDNGDSSDTSTQQNQWKIIGLTSLGVPQVPAVPLVTPSPFSALPVPFLMTETSSTAAPSQTISNSCSTAIASPFAGALSIISTSSSSFPAFTLAGSVGGTSLISSVSSPAPTSLQTFQSLVPQPNLSHLIQNQLSSYHTPVNVLAMNEPDQWNVVGVISNNQMSVLNLSASNPSVSSTAALVNNLTSSDPSSGGNESSSFEKTKAMSVVNESGIGGRKNASSKQSLAFKLKLSGQESMFTKSKNSHGKHENSRMKKNTVSNLLRMKRMQQRAHQKDGSSEEGEKLCEDPIDFSHPVEEIPTKKAKIRSLRSYAGNRKLFTKTQPRDVEEKISLRSGTQIPVPHYKSEENESMESAAILLEKEEEQAAADVSEVQEKEEKDVKEISKIDVHSSARRRKLKVPRKMVADMDYHPFDSSSDSN